MPLTPYKRGDIWWAKGRIEYNGRAITKLYRCSTGSFEEAGARDWITQEETRVIRHYLLGEDPEALTFSKAATLYPAKPADAKFLIKIVLEIGERKVASLSPAEIKALCPLLYPTAATDTWKRQVLTPISAVINHAHQLGQCPPIRIKGFSAQERIDQDARRGKESRQNRPAGSWEWIRAVQPHANPYVAAALEFMFETGARISQTTALRPADIDLATARVRMPAAKGHAAKWVAISPELVSVLANLPPRRPYSRAQGKLLTPRVFGYSERTGLTTALKSACKAAKQPYLTPHEAGRHGFYTELRVRQGLDPITVAEAGRWTDASLPDRVYAHSETGEVEMRARIRGTDPGATDENASEVVAIKTKKHL